MCTCCHKDWCLSEVVACLKGNTSRRSIRVWPAPVPMSVLRSCINVAAVSLFVGLASVANESSKALETA